LLLKKEKKKLSVKVSLLFSTSLKFWENVSLFNEGYLKRSQNTIKRYTNYA
jgi:hypothetical protein